MKLNTDGAAKENPGDVSIGGILRDEQGKWLARYYGKIGISTSLVAELWSIRSGIAIEKELGFKKLIVESNSRVANDMLKRKYEILPPLLFYHCWLIVHFTPGE